MKRQKIPARPNWQEQLQAIGFTFYNLPSEGGRPYWNETTGYCFTPAEVEQLEAATKELFDRCLDAVDYVITNKKFADFAIPESYWEAITASWNRDDPTIYGRFDLAYDGKTPPKLLEFNADTPTSLIESSVAQWHWVCDTFGGKADQFNSLHEKLITQWRWLREDHLKLPKGARLHLASVHDAGDGKLVIEDYDTVSYMAETAQLAGFDTKQIFMEEIGWDGEQFVDGDAVPIERCFKLYPWEWIAREPFADKILESIDKTMWLEPLWKMILSNKQLLVVLWQLFPNHPNLLPAFNNAQAFAGKPHVKKPKLSREGANVVIYDTKGAIVEQMPGDYGSDGYVYQAFAPLAQLDGKKAVIGSWIVGDEPAGIDIRETSSFITGDLAEFVPHFVTG
jgi:glutathionylspermidine synthase